MTTPIRPSHSARFYVDAPSWQDADGSSHWVLRAANFVVVATKAAAGAVLRREAAAQADEYMALLPEDTGATFAAGADTVTSVGDSLAILPPGDSSITVPRGGWLYRVFSHRMADLATLAANAQAYADGMPDVAPLVDWPAPVGGFKLRHYQLADHVRSDTTMRLFRSSNLMINIFLPGKAARDVNKMTPHSHADFEQGSLALVGSYVHHLRFPWTPNLPLWREDEHDEIGSPSLIVIPPKVIHTSQSVGTPPMRLVDIFAPPRADFSLKPGLVCNAADYPLPERLRDVAPVANAA